MEPKKPTIYLLVILPILAGGGIAVVMGLIVTYSRIVGVQLHSISDLNGMLISLPAFFLWIPVSLMLSNCVLYIVSPFRSIAEEYVARAKRPGFGDTQRMLGKILLYMSFICMPLIALGFIV